MEEGGRFPVACPPENEKEMEMSLLMGHDETVRFASPANDERYSTPSRAEGHTVDLLVSLEESLRIVRDELKDTHAKSEDYAVKEAVADGVLTLSRTEAAVLLLANLSKYESRRSEFDVGDLLVASDTYMKKPLGASLVYQTIEALTKYGAFELVGKAADPKTGRKSRTFKITPAGRAFAMLVVLIDRELRTHQSLAA